MSEDRYGDIRRRELDQPLTAAEAYEMARVASARAESVRALQENVPAWYAGYLAAQQNQQRPR